MADIAARQAADYLIAFSREVGDPLTNLKLQKLLYYAQGWYLALYDVPLFGERIEAWAHGPAVPPVYEDFKGWRWQPIGGGIQKPQVGARVKSHLDEIMQVFGVLNAYELERMTHREAPWLDARGALAMDEPSHEVISTDSMKKFFKAVAAEAKPVADQNN